MFHSGRGLSKMIGRITTFVVGGLCLVTSPPAQAGDAAQASNSSGFYVIGRVGSALPIDQDITSEVLGEGDYDPDGGFGLQGAIGKHLGGGWRAEVSYTWLRGTDGKATFDDSFFPVELKLDGRGESDTVLFNVLRTVGTFDTFVGQVSPFVGAGIGFSHLDRSDITLAGAPSGFLAGDSTDTVFAAAAHIGFETELAPGVTLSSQWSFQYADEAHFDNVLFGTDLTRDGQVQVLSFTGLRFDLN